MTEQTPPVDMPHGPNPEVPPVDMPTLSSGHTPVDIPSFGAPAEAESSAGDVDPETLAEIRGAEASQQRSLCDIPEGDLPDELVEALELRVQVNLAQHDGGEVRRVGSTDPRVRELEAPWTHKARRATGA